MADEKTANNPQGLPIAGAGAQAAGSPIPAGPKAPAKPDSSKVGPLAAKGGGNLVRHPGSGVWSYPGAPMDNSGTNVHLPVEYVTDAEVRAALDAGELHPIMGDGNSVRVRGSNNAPPIAISMAMAGSPEVGTELPIGSRPSHDAGMKRFSPEETAAEQRKAAEAAAAKHAENTASVAATASRAAETARVAAVPASKK